MKSSNSVATLNNNIILSQNELPTKSHDDLHDIDYHRFLAQKYCKKWRDFVLRKNRSIIRAIVHHNYAQYQRIWDRWMSKLDTRILQFKKYEMAVGYANILLLRVAFDGFIAYHRKRKEKKKAITTANDYYKRNLASDYISKWHNRASLRRFRSSLNQIACLMSDKNRLSRFFHSWNDRWFHCDQLYKQNALAFETNLVFTMRKPFRRWIHIAKKYQRLKSSFNYSISLSGSKRKRNLLLQWKRKTWFVIESNNNMEKAIALANQKITKTTWIFWIQKYKLHQKYWHIIQTLLIKRERRNKRIILDAFYYIRRISLSAETKANIRIADQCFSKWKSKTALSLDRRYMKALEPGKQFYNRKITLKALKAFMLNVEESKLEKTLNQAVIIFRLDILFKKWSKLTSLKRSRRLNESAALLYHHLTMLNESWTSWKEAQDQKIITENLFVTAHKWQKLTTLKQYFMIMKTRHFSIHEEYMNDIEATNIGIRAKTKLYFTKWMNRTVLKAQNTQNIDRAIHFRRIVDIKSAWINWGKTMIRKKQSRIKNGLTQAIYERNHLKKHFYALLSYTRMKKFERDSFFNFQLKAKIRNLSFFFDQWKKVKRVVFLMNLDARCFLDDQQRIFLGKIIFVWNSRMKKYRSLRKRLEKRKVLEEKDLIYSVFVKWDKQYKISCKQSKDVMTSMCLNFRRVARNSLHTWKILFKHRLWIKHHHGIAVQHYEQRILKILFSKWYSKFPDWRSKYIRRHVLPLALSGLNLCKKAFLNWKLFVSEKKKINSSIAEVKKIHKQIMIKDIFRRWFEVAQEQAWEAQAKSGLTESQLRAALKYGTRWRFLAFKSARNKPKAPLWASSWRIPFNLNENELNKSFQPRTRTMPRYPLFLESAVKQTIQPPILAKSNIRIGSKVDNLEKEQSLSEEEKQKEVLSEMKKMEQKQFYLNLKKKVDEIETQLKEYCDAQPLSKQKPSIDFGNLLLERGKLLSEMNKLAITLY